MADDGKIDHIAELQKKLYARDTGGFLERRVGILRPIKTEVKNAWGSKKPVSPKKKYQAPLAGYKRFFAFSILFLVLCLGFLGYSFLKGANTLSAKNVDLVILGNSFVSGGEELPIQIEIANKNDTVLSGVVLTVEYPKGSVDRAGAELVRIRKDLGTIESGKALHESFTAILYGEQGSTRTIKATIEYRLPNSNIPFVKETIFPVIVSSSPIELVVEAPVAHPANQSIALSVKTKLVTDQAPEDMVLKIEYPVGFKYATADFSPAMGNNIWSLADLSQGAERTITVRGLLAGQNGDEKSFRVYVGSRESVESNSLAVTYNSALHTVLLDKPFLEAQIAVGDRKGSVVALEREAPVAGSIQWKNNLGTQLADPEVILYLTGASVDEDSVIATQGFYDSARNAIVWNKDTALSFRDLAPNASGSFTFSFKPIASSQGGRPDDINLSLSVGGKSADAGFESRLVDGVDRLTIKFIGSLNFTDQVSYSTGPIRNTGPIPPAVEKTTTYTITWKISPGETAVSQVEAKARLPFYVGWGGVVSPNTESLVFDPDTRTVIWRVGSIPQSVGGSATRSVSFQVAITPSRSQLGSMLNLLDTTSISGVDSATSALLQLTRTPLTTELQGDPAFKPGNEKVVQ